MSSFVALVTVILNFIVYSDCEDFVQKEMLSKALADDAHFETNEDVNKEFIKPKASTIARKNFIPLEDLKKLQRVKTVKDFRREFKYDSMDNDYRRTINDLSGGLYLENVYCNVRLTAVEIPLPSQGFYYPSFVELHRCTGGCTYVRQDIHHCVAKKTEDINVWVMYIGYYRKRRRRSVRGLPWKEDFPVKRQQNMVLIPMVNHTGCGCECVVQPSDCDEATQDYSIDYCKCLCKNRSSTCDSSYQVWDNENCQCKCKYPPIACANTNKLWSPDTCKCECSNSIKKRCVRKNKLLNHDTCSCYCSPEISCETKVLSTYDCSCVDL